MWMLRRPRESQVIEFLMKSARKPLNYASQAQLSNDYQATQFSTQIYLGNGIAAYRKAVNAMHDWQMIRTAGADLFWPERGLQRGTTLAIGMRAFGLYWLNPCRITEISETPIMDRQCSDLKATVGWRTVDGHSLKGGELFSVRFARETGDVWYEISSIAIPAGWLRPWQTAIDRLRKSFQLQTCRQMSIVLGRHNQHDRMLPASEPIVFEQRV